VKPYRCLYVNNVPGRQVKVEKASELSIVNHHHHQQQQHHTLSLSSLEPCQADTITQNAAYVPD